MTDINIAVIGGHLASDSKLIQSGNLQKLTYTVAVNEWFPDRSGEGGQGKEEVSFVSVQTYGRSAVTLQNVLKKGVMVYVQGKVKQVRWEKDGKKNSITYIRSTMVRYEQQQGQNQTQTTTKAPANVAPKKSVAQPDPNPDPMNAVPPEDYADDSNFPF